MKYEFFDGRCTDEKKSPGQVFDVYTPLDFSSKTRPTRPCNGL